MCGVTEKSNGGVDADGFGVGGWSQRAVLIREEMVDVGDEARGGPIVGGGCEFCDLCVNVCQAVGERVDLGYI